MQNGHDHARAAGAPMQMQVNPQQAAQFALTFLARADMKPAERDAYAVAEGLLNAILSGQVVLAPPAPPAVASEAPGPESAAPAQ
jgi:hypothetical protein